MHCTGLGARCTWWNICVGFSPPCYSVHVGGLGSSVGWSAWLVPVHCAALDECICMLSFMSVRLFNRNLAIFGGLIIPDLESRVEFLHDNVVHHHAYH